MDQPEQPTLTKHQESPTVARPTEQYVRELHESGLILTGPDPLGSGTEDLLSLSSHRTELAPVLTAPVQIPARELLSVKLVPLETVERLEEYRSDENVALTFLGTALGGVLGFLVNVVTNGTELSRGSWAFLGLLLLVVVFLLYNVVRSRRRASRLKRRMAQYTVVAPVPVTDHSRAKAEGPPDNDG